MSRYVGIATVQRPCYNLDIEANLVEMEKYIDAIVLEAPFTDIIVFPELCMHGFNTEFAEPIPGPISERFQKKAREVGKWIIPGTQFERDGDKVYNSMLLISPEGKIIEKYRKMNPFSPLEASVPGDRYCVVDIPGIGKIGMCICYDFWFPETVRTLVALGAEIIIHPTFTPSAVLGLEKIFNLANAAFNQVYLVGSSICGESAGFTLGGNSVIVDPEGLILQEAGDGPTVLTEILDLDKVSMVRKYGSKGLAPLLKHLKHYGHEFPIYNNQKARGPGIDNLGPITSIEEYTTSFFNNLKK